MTPEQSDRNRIAEAATAEVHDLHRVLQAWFRGEGGKDPELVLSRFDEGFRMVGAAGSALGLADFAAALPKMWGSRPSLVMEITDLAVRHVEGRAAIVVYRETQTQDDGANQRWASAVLLDRPEGPTPSWLHLQETWCAPSPAA